MTYSDFETSVDGARPVELYRIDYSGNHWYYTSADTPITFQGVTYMPVACSSDTVDLSSDPTKAAISATFPRDIPFADLFRVQPPSEVVVLTVFALNYNDPSGDTNFVTKWIGRIINVSWEGQYTKLTTESALGSMQRVGLRRRYSASCPYALYSAACGVQRSLYRQDSTISSLNGLQIIVPAAAGTPDGRYGGGYITWINNVNGNTEKRMIRDSVGSSGTLMLASLPVGLALGQAVSIYRGCKHIIGAGGCTDFNNTDNYGGMPYIPRKNPFGNVSLF